MSRPKVSVIIPARNERFLQHTIDSLLSNARGEVEIFAVIDGHVLPMPPIRPDPRVHVLEALTQGWPTQRENGETSVGMRAITNHVAPLVSGRYLMKCDAHCIFAEGWDVALASQCEEDWVVVPTRHSVDPETWTVCGRGGSRLDLRLGGVNYHYLTFPYAESMYGYGLHGKEFNRQINRQMNLETLGRPIDDLMSFQGSCWFTPTANFHRLGPLDQENYYFYSEAIEVGMRQWISGGRVVINKTTWYAHLHKGEKHTHTFDGRGHRGYWLDLRKKRSSEAFATDFWMNDRLPGLKRTFAAFIERFQPLLERIPTDEKWPIDWADPKHRVNFLNRTPDQIPAHL